MLTRNLLILSIVLNVALAAAAMFFRLDNSSLHEQCRALSAERDKAIAESRTMELNAQALQNKLNAMAQTAETPEDESAERLLKDIAMKDEMIAALRKELDNSDRQRPERQTTDRRQRQAVSDYRELLKANQELMQSAMTGDRESSREMWENQRAINEMAADVRTILLEQYGKSIGATGAQLADQVNQILDATSSGFGGFGGGRGGRGR